MRFSAERRYWESENKWDTHAHRRRGLKTCADEWLMAQGGDIGKAVRDKWGDELKEGADGGRPVFTMVAWVESSLAQKNWCWRAGAWPKACGFMWNHYDGQRSMKHPLQPSGKNA